MEKRFSVMYRTQAGLIGIGWELSKHSTTKAAFRQLHHYANNGYDEEDLYVYDNEADHSVLEVKTKNSKGRWVTI